MSFVFDIQGKSVTSLESSLAAMVATRDSLNDEMGSDLLSQLSMEDQREVDGLNDKVKLKTEDNRSAWKERIRV